MKENEMKKMNDMVKVKRNYPMEILTMENINLERDMAQELIDSLMVLVI